MVAFAGLYGDTPDAKHAWAVHDMNRPKPAKVEVGANGVPSDAVVLFDGTKASFEKNWRDGKGNPSKWRYSDEGYFYTDPEWKNGGAIYSREEFGAPSRVPPRSRTHLYEQGRADARQQRRLPDG